VEGERLVKRVILEDLSVVETQGAAGEMLTNGRLPRGTVTWVQKSGKEDGQRGDQEITAEYQLDGTGVVVHLSDGSLLRIGKIKVEGSTSKPARHVLESIGSK
jgi:methionyl-tRNA formyltransferase